MPSNPDPAAADALADVIETVLRMALAPVVTRVRALETAAADLTARYDVAAVLGDREPVPGPPGPAGPAGKDGADGLGFDDYRIEFDGERTITHTWQRGDRIETRAITVPAMIYRGVYAPGKAYGRGDCVTWGGSLWHCNVDTVTRPGDGDPAWTLAVKRGRDAK